MRDHSVKMFKIDGNELPEEFFQTLRKSKTAVKMWKLFKKLDVKLEIFDGYGGYFVPQSPDLMIIKLGNKFSSVEYCVAVFCHEMVHRLQPFDWISIGDLKQKLSPSNYSAFRDRQVALHFWREIAAYKMTNRVLRELGASHRPLEEQLYIDPVGDYRSSLNYYRNRHSDESIENFLNRLNDNVITALPSGTFE